MFFNALLLETLFSACFGLQIIFRVRTEFETEIVSPFSILVYNLSEIFQYVAGPKRVYILLFMNRGGAEDTRLEAKANYTKKIRGQGRPFRGQTLSRPRTGMLEAKAKNHGHSHKCSPK